VDQNGNKEDIEGLMKVLDLVSEFDVHQILHGFTFGQLGTWAQ
jgi:hypothetical protein